MLDAVHSNEVVCALVGLRHWWTQLVERAQFIPSGV